MARGFVRLIACALAIKKNRSNKEWQTGAREKLFDALNDSPNVVEELAVAVVPCGGGWKVEPTVVPCNWRLWPQLYQREALLDLALPAVILFVAHDASFLSRLRLLHVGIP